MSVFIHKKPGFTQNRAFCLAIPRAQRFVHACTLSYASPSFFSSLKSSLSSQFLNKKYFFIPSGSPEKPLRLRFFEYSESESNSFQGPPFLYNQVNGIDVAKTMHKILWNQFFVASYPKYGIVIAVFSIGQIFFNV
jgi:hypothetical protein